MRGFKKGHCSAKFPTGKEGSRGGCQCSASERRREDRKRNEQYAVCGGEAHGALRNTPPTRHICSGDKRPGAPPTCTGALSGKNPDKTSQNPLVKLGFLRLWPRLARVTSMYANPCRGLVLHGGIWSVVTVELCTTLCS